MKGPKTSFCFWSFDMYICFFMLIIFSLQIFVLHLFALSIKGFLQTCIMQCFSCIYLLWSQVLFLQTRIMQCLSCIYLLQRQVLFLQTRIMQCLFCIYLLWRQVLFLQTRIMQCLPDPFHQQWTATPIQTRRPLSSISIKSQPNF